MYSVSYWFVATSLCMNVCMYILYIIYTCFLISPTSRYDTGWSDPTCSAATDAPGGHLNLHAVPRGSLPLFLHPFCPDRKFCPPLYCPDHGELSPTRIIWFFVMPLWFSLPSPPQSQHSRDPHRRAHIFTAVLGFQARHGIMQKKLLSKHKISTLSFLISFICLFIFFYIFCFFIIDACRIGLGM